MFKQLWKSAAIWILFVSCIPPTPARTEPKHRHGDNKPSMQFDLKRFGYDREKSGLETLRNISIAFISDNILAITYHTRLESALNAIFFDPLTGQTRFTHTWTEGSELFPTHDGRFLVRDDVGLTLYSPDFEPLTKLAVDCAHQRYGNWCYDVWVPPSGRQIFLHIGTSESFKLQKIDADTLTELHAWNDERPLIGMLYFGRDSIAADKIVTTGNDFNPKSLYLGEIGWAPLSSIESRCLTRTDPNWREIYHANRSLVATPSFLTNDLIALGGARSVVLLSTDGKVLMNDHPVSWPKYLVGGVQHSSDGSRFALTIGTQWGNFSDFASIHRFRGAVVYGVQERKAIFMVEYGPAWSQSVALSPHGTLLAIFQNGVVEVFRLPAGLS